MHRINHPQPQIIRNIVLRVSRHVNGFSDHACTRYLAVVSISCRLVLMRSYFQHLWEMRKLPGLSAACNFALSVEHSKISRRQVLATFGRLQIWLIASKQIKWMEKGLGTGASQDKKIFEIVHTLCLKQKLDNSIFWWQDNIVHIMYIYL